MNNSELTLKECLDITSKFIDRMIDQGNISGEEIEAYYMLRYYIFQAFMN